MRLRHRVRTSASPAQVWDVLGDPSRWPDVALGLKRVRGAHGPAQADQHLLGVARFLGLRIPIDVVESVPGKRLVLRSHILPGVVEQTTYELIPTTRGGTDIAVSTVLDGLFAGAAVLPVWATVGVTARVLAVRVDRARKTTRRAGAA